MMPPERPTPAGEGRGPDRLGGRVGKEDLTSLRGCVDCNGEAVPTLAILRGTLVVAINVAHDASCPAWKSGGPIGRPDAMPKPDLELRWPR